MMNAGFGGRWIVSVELQPPVARQNNPMTTCRLVRAASRSPVSREKQPHGPINMNGPTGISWELVSDPSYPGHR